MPKKWKTIDRKKVFDSKFVRVFIDTVQLPNGTIIDDYSVIEKYSFVVVVATDTKGRLIAIREYKHAVGKVMHALPAGHVENGESVVKAAKRELREEVGATGGVFMRIGTLYDYPTKDLHRGYVVRATGVELNARTEHEATESIALEVLTIPELKRQIKAGKWQASGMLAALVLAGILS